MPGFFCLWIPQFAAWALSQSESALRNRPFAVGERGVVVAASRLALDAGVRVGQTSGKAQSRLSALLLVSRDPSRETLAWDEVQRTLYGLTPQVEAISPGLLFASVDPKKALPLVRTWNCHGGNCHGGNCQGGAGSDRATAQLAALSAPHGQARIVKGGREAVLGDLAPLCLLREAGISEATLQRLNWFGWKTVGALRVVTRRQLEEQVGADGLMLFRFAQGPKLRENTRPVTTWHPPEEVSAALWFEFPAREPCEWESALDQLLERVCQGLGSRSARTLEVRLETPIAPLCARRVLKEATSSARVLQAPARAALDEGLRLLAPLPPVIQGIEVRLGALSCPPVQASLFEGQKAEKTERPQRLRAAFEEVERRFIGHVSPSSTVQSVGGQNTGNRNMGSQNTDSDSPDSDAETVSAPVAINGHYVPDQSDSPFPEEIWRFESTSGWLRALESLHSNRKQSKREQSKPNSTKRTEAR